MKYIPKARSPRKKLSSTKISPPSVDVSPPICLQLRETLAAALACLDQVAEAWEMEREGAGQLLSWAARMHEVGLHGEVLAFTGMISLMTGLVFGALPILRFRRSAPVNALKEGGRSSDGRERHRMRTVLVVSQVALSLVLLVGSGSGGLAYRARIHEKVHELKTRSPSEGDKGE